MKRDVTVIPFLDQSLVVASDNSGGIGLKEKDFVQVPYEVVAYYSFRVAVMECLSAGARPISVVIHNFCDDESWDAVVSGVKKGLRELGMPTIPITGSTESNFPLLQSALGIVVLGVRGNSFMETSGLQKSSKLAVIGMPLVGQEVVNRNNEVLPLPLFQELCHLGNIDIIPVGSKGVLYELQNLLGDDTISPIDLIVEVDVLKSAGPSTCILMAFPPELEPTVKKISDHFYHSLIIG